MVTDLVSALIKGTSEEQREAIKQMTEERLKWKLGGIDKVPPELSFIVTEVSIARFNRIGSEGLSDHTVDGETMRWSDDDFAPYESDIQDYREKMEGNGKGVVMFL